MKRTTGQRDIVLDPHCLQDLDYWTRSHRRLALRALRLIEATMRGPFDGPGKPERLRGELAGFWSRRIDDEHRLVYQVDEDRVYFVAARHHYRRQAR